MGDDLAPFRPFLGLELLYNRIFIIFLHVLSYSVNGGLSGGLACTNLGYIVVWCLLSFFLFTSNYFLLLVVCMTLFVYRRHSSDDPHKHDQNLGISPFVFLLVDTGARTPIRMSGFTFYTMVRSVIKKKGRLKCVVVWT
jgi:hypothetical protein